MGEKAVRGKPALWTAGGVNNHGIQPKGGAMFRTKTKVKKKVKVY